MQSTHLLHILRTLGFEGSSIGVGVIHASGEFQEAHLLFGGVPGYPIRAAGVATNCFVESRPIEVEGKVSDCSFVVKDPSRLGSLAHCTNGGTRDGVMGSSAVEGKLWANAHEVSQ